MAPRIPTPMPVHTLRHDCEGTLNAFKSATPLHPIIFERLVFKRKAKVFHVQTASLRRLNGMI